MRDFLRRSHNTEVAGVDFHLGAKLKGSQEYEGWLRCTACDWLGGDNVDERIGSELKVNCKSIRNLRIDNINYCVGQNIVRIRRYGYSTFVVTVSREVSCVPSNARDGG